jgi:predicted MPP superfamily phosphohydrolase
MIVLKKSAVIMFFVFLIAGLFAGYCLLIEPYRVQVTRWTVSTPKWTNDKPLKIAVIADPHLIYPWKPPAFLKRVIEKTNALQPDIILLLGDYIGTHALGWPVNPEEGTKPYGDLKAPLGIYAIVGNHDVVQGYPEAKGWLEALSKKVTVLQNQAIKTGDFWIAGLEEPYRQNPDIEKTMESITDQTPVIMMTHNPDMFPEIPDRVALTLAGHTHAGQVQLPFIGALPQVVPSVYGLRFLHGHIREGTKDLIVSSGLGETGLPIRLNALPEIVLVTLEKENNPAVGKDEGDDGE